MRPGVCTECHERISDEKRSDARYCSSTCKSSAEKHRQRVRKGLAIGKRRGPYRVSRKDYHGKLALVNLHAKRIQERKVVSRVSRPGVREEALRLGFRSGFERTLAASLQKRKVKFEYETLKLPYEISHVYSPDFMLPNGVIIEAKGKLTPQDRSKMIAVKRRYPELDIRFVFMRGENKLTAKGKTTYMQWAEKNGFPAADGEIPEQWVKPT